MISKKITRTRHWCDYCKKGFWQRPAAEKHESICTRNPGRRCGVCEILLEEEQPDIEALKAMLPDPEGQWLVDEYDFKYLPNEFKKRVEAAIPALSNAANGCPMCMLAALRQRGIPAPIAESLNVEEAMAEIWQEVNERDHCDYIG